MTNYKETYMWKEINETPQILKNTYSKNIELIKEVASIIKNSDKTNFVLVGRGTSDHALMYFKNAIEILTPYTASLASSSVVTIYNGNIDFKNSVVIGCSQSGQAQDVYTVLEKANQQGAITVSITNFEDSVCAKGAKYHFNCSCGEEISVAATKTFSAQLYLLILLASSLSDNKTLFDSLKNLSDNLDKNISDIDSKVNMFLEKCEDMTNGFILSRGVTFPIALEASLKLQETSYVRMSGYPYSDFYHGPMAMVNEDTPILIYASNSNSDAIIKETHKNDIIACVDKMSTLSKRVSVVTDNEEIYDTANDKANAIKLNKSDSEFESMFNFALFAQIFACKYSCHIGNNPDSPRALKKVTITK